MADIHSLEQTLFDNLPWNKARIKFVARFLMALYAVRTVNLSILATAFSGRAQEDSNYKRLERFLREFELPYAELAGFIVRLLGIAGPWRLAMDRTNWKVGAININILMLSIIHRGIGFPVVWIVLPKAGNSDTSERETVIEIFMDLFGRENIASLLGDREFVGKAWFRFLKRHRINFQLRLCKTTLVRNGRGQMVQAWRLFASTRINQMLVIPEARRMWGFDLFLSGCRLPHGEYLILVAPEFSEAPEQEYKLRWGIETLFGALKSRGFNLEDTRLQDPERISRLLALLAIAFTWAFIVGQWQAVVKDLKLKKHGYPPKSIFRLGLNMLCRLATNFEGFNLAHWHKVIRLLSCS
ncbi:MAG: IS4 family transposase [Blastocatellales bacterium]|nr:IS4 family transposase [Blastocatellales bacterium]